MIIPFYMNIFDNRTDFRFAIFIDHLYHVLHIVCLLSRISAILTL